MSLVLLFMGFSFVESAMHLVQMLKGVLCVRIRHRGGDKVSVFYSKTRLNVCCDAEKWETENYLCSSQ